MTVYIHALREEGDLGFCKQVGQVADISIHALREEGDREPVLLRRRGPYFYPRPPRGGRRGFCSFFGGGASISIHALREEGDRA